MNSFLGVRDCLPRSGTQVVLERCFTGELAVAIRHGKMWEIFAETTEGYITFFTKINKRDSWCFDKPKTPSPSSSPEIGKKNLSEFIYCEENEVKVRFSSDDWEGGCPPPSYKFSLAHLVTDLGNFDNSDETFERQTRAVSLMRQKTM